MYTVKEFYSRRIERISSARNIHKAKFAQYLSRAEIASFMVLTTMRYFQSSDTVDVLELGVGLGTLSCSMVNELINYRNSIINMDIFEVDKTATGEVEQSYNVLKKSDGINCRMHEKNFITDTGFEFAWRKGKQYDISIMNPPYKIINTHFVYKNVLYDIGINTVNTYTVFTPFGISMLKKSGNVTITYLKEKNMSHIKKKMLCMTILLMQAKAYRC